VNEDENKIAKTNNDPRRRNKQVREIVFQNLSPKTMLAFAPYAHYNIQILT